MNKLISEFMGTFSLVFTGCGAIIVNDLYGNILGHFGISIVFGLIIMAMIYSVGNVSGAHLNPAVTIGFYSVKRINLKQALLYIVSQIFGALFASVLLKIIFLSHPNLGATTPSGNILTSFLIEVILTFLLMFIIINVSTGHKEKGIMAGVAIGGFITLAALMGGPVSGASLNPARSIGPSIVSGNLHHLWIYILAPILGAVLASPFCKIIQGEKCLAVIETN
ncbi:MAG: aquaporin [Candidatus Cloacimonadota bacterium]|nr:aquaporin [Candidatus Cloacimonadota bacterium]